MSHTACKYVLCDLNCISTQHEHASKQASASAVVKDREQVRCRTRTIVRRLRGYEDVITHQFVPNSKISFFRHQRGTFVVVRHMRRFDPVFLTFFERRTLVTTCNVPRKTSPAKPTRPNEMVNHFLRGARLSLPPRRTLRTSAVCPQLKLPSFCYPSMRLALAPRENSIE